MIAVMGRVVVYFLDAMGSRGSRIRRVNFNLKFARFDLFASTACAALCLERIYESHLDKTRGRYF